MKVQSNYILFASDSAWRAVAFTGQQVVHDIAIPPATSVEETAKAAAVALAQMAPGGKSVVLAIPSQWCLCATISTADIPRGSSSARRLAMFYRLEEKLPLATEDLVADFVTCGSDQALGVAAEIRVLRPVIRAIESAGHVVQAVAPTALLAAHRYSQDLALVTQARVRGSRTPDHSDLDASSIKHSPPQTDQASANLDRLDALLFCYDGQLEFISLSRGQPTAWDVVPLDPDDAVRELSLHALEHSPPMRITCGTDVPPQVMSRLREIVQIHVIEMKSAPAEETAIRAAHSLALGRESWIQLRCGELGSADPFRPVRRAMNAAVIAAVLFCAALCGAMLWRAHVYQRMAGQFEREQGAAYTRAFDGKIPPQGLNIASRMNSEERRLRSLAGEATDVPSDPSALLLLQRLLARLPTQSHCDLSELRISDGKLYLAGIASSHGEASSFAAAISKDPTFHFDEPRTEQLPQAGATGVSMTLSGIVAPDPPASLNSGGQR